MRVKVCKVDGVWRVELRKDPWRGPTEVFWAPEGGWEKALDLAWVVYRARVEGSFPWRVAMFRVRGAL